MPHYVEKVRVPVRLSQPNADPRDGWLLLFPCVGNEHRTESLIELLNSRRTVIPFICAEDRSVLLLARQNIDWVALSPATTVFVFPPGTERNHGQRVELRFLDESRVEGTVEWYSEEGDQRLSDFLNSADAFVAASTGFGMLLWNKTRIREARILESSANRADAYAAQNSVEARAAR